MTLPLRLYMIRHGTADANLEMRYLGRKDDALNQLGRTQASQLAEVFLEVPVAAVYSSPLRRALDTARPIAESAAAPLRTDPRLVEMDFGSWDGKTRSDVRSEDSDLLARWEADPGRVAPPGGETLAEVLDRCLDLVNELCRAPDDGPAALVSHVGPVKALLCAALGLPLAAQSRLFLDPATVTVIDWGEPPVVRLVNDHAHLGWRNARWLRGA